jgi:excisionase family DNA binding protein
MSRTNRSEEEQERARYTWLTPSEVAERIGVESVDTVRELIRDGHLAPPGVMDVSRSSRPRYRISPEAVDRFIRESERRVKVG